MSEPFVGEIRMFAGNFAPRGWAFCDGQLLAVSQNDALFSLLGTIYGGDGRTTFGLPDLRGRVPIHAGQGPGLSERRVGVRGGQERVTLTQPEMPPHSHRVVASASRASAEAPAPGRAFAAAEEDLYASTVSGREPMAAGVVNAAGGTQAHTNLMPFTCVHFIIALFGIYPSRN